MSDLLDETLEEMRENKLKESFYRLGKWLGLAAAFVLIVIFAVSWQKGRVEELAQKRGAEFMEATMKIRAQDVGGGMAKLEQLVQLDDTNYSGLAALHYAAILSYKKEYDKAAEVYQKLADSSRVDNNLRDYARYMQICTMLIEKPEAIEEAITKLEAGFSERSRSAFKPSAREMLLALYVKQKDAEKAKIVLAQLEADKAAPTMLKKRARDIMSVLSE